MTKHGLPLLAILMTSSLVSASDGWYESFESAKKASEERGVPLLIHFHAPWCGPCRQMASSVLSRAEVRQQLRSGLAAVEVDVSTQPEIAQKYGAVTVPRDVVVEPGKSAKTLNIGLKSLPGYLALLKSVAKDEGAVIKAKKNDDTALPIIGLEGFCPVKLLKEREWVSGKEQLTDTYRGITYYFSDQQARETFQESPRTYSPQNLGCDPVVLYKDQQALAGKIRFGAFFDDQLFLFNSFENRKKFKEAPLKYTRIQHAVRTDQLSGQRFN